METFLYTPQIPCGVARTKGYGKTCAVYVIRADREKFKTLRSKHKVIKYFGTVRMDYGLKRGHSRKILDLAADWVKMTSLPEPRTTKEEF